MKQNFANNLSLSHSLGMVYTHLFHRLIHHVIARHYFAISTNPGEQFYAFTNLAAWLIDMCGRSMEQPQEVTSSIMYNISCSP